MSIDLGSKTVRIQPVTRHGKNHVLAVDEQTFGAYHEYTISNMVADEVNILQTIRFQKGPIQEHGVNGIQIEDLLAICQHRLACFQAGPFACSENQQAHDLIRSAIDILDKRTADRKARSVEGKSEK